MTIKFSAALPALCLAAGMLTGVAHATAFSVTAYTDPSGNVVDPSTLTYKLGAASSAAANSFTVTSFNMFSDGTSANPYTIQGFISKSGNSPISTILGGQSLANTELVFTGTTYLVNGQTYTFTHDDGMTLSVNGSSVINSPGQTAATGSSFTYSGPTGSESFVLDYAENGVAPATLTGPFTAATPEPSSIMLLGTGLLGVAGMVRRRLAR